MKFWIRSHKDAAALCDSCRKSTYQNRLITVAPSHESTIAESELTVKATSSKAFFIVGGVGSIITAIAAIWSFLETFTDSLFFWAIGNVLLVIGIILASIGYLGMRYNYGSGIGVASFAIAIVVSVLVLLRTAWQIVGTEFDYNWLLNIYVWSVIYEIFFVMIILWGVTHITTRYFSGNLGVSLASGTMHIITAVFLQITILFQNITFGYLYQSRYYEEELLALLDIMKILDLVWILFFFVSQILATVLFFIAKVPGSSRNTN